MFNSFITYFVSFLPSQVLFLVTMMLALPLLSVSLIILFGKKINSGVLINISSFSQVLLSAYLIMATYTGITFHRSLSWLQLSTNKAIYIGIYVDFLAAIMLCIISIVSYIVYLYSIAYVQNDVAKERYFILLNLFVSTIFWVIVADNLWGVFIGWEFLGILSCLLIAFWHKDYWAVKSGIKTWLITKVGSMCFLVGILLILSSQDQDRFLVLANVTIPSIWLTGIGICFLAAAFSKSVQFPFFNWLPHAMVAPTPISALLHSATLVSVGLYFLIRVYPLLLPEFKTMLVVVGHATAFMGAVAALFQQHIKRMLAYSTISQLGYVTAAIGLNMLESGMLYLLSHALAKACLFLCIGVVVKFLQEQKKEDVYDMSNMSGLAFYFPWVASSYLIAVLVLIGMPTLTGFNAKENILFQTMLWSIGKFSWNFYLFVYLIPILSFIAVLLTPVYLSISFIKIFMGAPKWHNNVNTIEKTLFKGTSRQLLQGSIILSGIGTLVVSLYPIKKFISYGFSHMGLIDDFSSYTLKKSLSMNFIGMCIWAILSLGSILWIIIICSRRSRNNSLLTNFTRWQQIFIQGWYLDTVNNWIAGIVLQCSKFVVVADRQLERLLCYLVGMYARTAQSVAWIDTKFIPGLEYEIIRIVKNIGKSYLKLSESNIQRSLIWIYIGIFIMSICLLISSINL